MEFAFATKMNTCAKQGRNPSHDSKFGFSSHRIPLLGRLCKEAQQESIPILAVVKDQEKAVEAQPKSRWGFAPQRDARSCTGGP